GCSGATWVSLWPPRRTRSIAVLVRNIETFSPAVSPPLAMVKATDESCVSIPLVSRITSLSVSVAIVISSVVARRSRVTLRVRPRGTGVFGRSARTVDRKSRRGRGRPVRRAEQHPPVRLAAILLHAGGQLADRRQTCLQQ